MLGILGVALIASFVAILPRARGADGSGTMSVAPTTAAVGSSGNTLAFTFTAAESMPSGGLSLTVPSGWTAPQGTQRTAGYTTVSSGAGTIADVVNTMDTLTNWQKGNCGSISADTMLKHEGAASILCSNWAQGSGKIWYYRPPSAVNWSSYTTVGFWMYSSLAVAANDFSFAFSSANNLGSPQLVPIAAAIPANTWTYIVLDLGSTTRSSILSYGFRQGVTDSLIKHANINTDDLLAGPGSPTFPGGGAVNARLLQLAGGQTVTVTYGALGGASGATAPGSVQTSTFNAQTRTNDGGTLTAIASSPTVQVVSPATKFVILPPAGGPVGTPVTVTVQAQDASGNVDTSYQNGVTLVADGSATGAGLVNIVNGVGTKSVDDTTAETVHLSLSDTQATGLNVSSTQTLAFAPGPVASFALNAPAGITAGSRAAYVVTRKDQYGNLVTSGSTAVYLYSSSTGTYAFYGAASGGSPLTHVAIADASSTADFWYQDTKVGSWTVTASDNATAPDGAAGIADATDAIGVTAGSVSAFLLNHPGNVTAGTRLGYVLSRADAYGNAVASGSTTAYLYSTSTGAHAFYAASAGGSAITSVAVADGSSTADFWYLDGTVGTWTVTASDNATAPDGAAGIADATDQVTVQAAPIVATRFVLSVSPSRVLAGQPATATVRAEDASGALDASEQRGVTLVTTGAATGGGAVDVVNGVGTTTVKDDVAQTVTLSLSDSAGTGLDVSSTQTLLVQPHGQNLLPPSTSAPPAAPSAGGPPSAPAAPPPPPVPAIPSNVAVLQFDGVAAPGSRVEVLAPLQVASASVVQETTAGKDGSFALTFNDTPGAPRPYALQVTDPNGRAAPLALFTVQPKGGERSALTVPVPPTLGLLRAVATKGAVLSASGYAPPHAAIELRVDGAPALQTASGADGSFDALVPTGTLALGPHVLVADVQDGPASQTLGFTVSSLLFPQTDLNGDGKVDLSDWSIFLAKYASPTPDLALDFDGDGKVDIADFSIFIRTLTP